MRCTSTRLTAIWQPETRGRFHLPHCPILGVHFSRPPGPDEKICIVLAGLRGEDSIAELCRREGIDESLFYRWSKVFLEAAKKRLSGDTAR